MGTHGILENVEFEMYCLKPIIDRRRLYFPEFSSLLLPRIKS